METLVSTSSYRTRDIARAVQRSPRTVRRYLEQKYPDHEGWHLFTAEEFERIVKDLKPVAALRWQRRNCWLHKR